MHGITIARRVNSRKTAPPAATPATAAGLSLEIMLSRRDGEDQKRVLTDEDIHVHIGLVRYAWYAADDGARARTYGVVIPHS